MKRIISRPRIFFKGGGMKDISKLTPFVFMFDVRREDE